MKRRFPDYEIRRLVARTSPVNLCLPSDEEFDGEDYKVPVIIDGNAGFSSMFSTAQAVADPAKSKAFIITRKEFHGVAKIKNELVLAATKKRGAFRGGVKTNVEGIWYSMGRQKTVDIYGDGKGYIANIKTGSSVAGTVMTLDNPNDTIYFTRGQTYQLVDPAAGSGAGALRATTTLECSKIDDANGTVTFTANINTVAGVQAGDAVVVADTFNLRWKGLRAWLVNNPTSTLFNGVDRTDDPTGLAGHVVDGSSLTPWEAIQELCKRIYRKGGRPNICTLHPDQMQKLLNYLEGKTVIVQQIRVSVDQVLRMERAARRAEEMTAEEGFEEFAKATKMDPAQAVPGFEAVSGNYASAGYAGISINTQTGPLAVYSDPSCPSKDLFVLQTDTWRQATLGPAPRLVEQDGLVAREVHNDAAVEVRTEYYGDLACNAPGFNGRATGLAALAAPAA